MKVMPYITFNGNCARAIELYEKAFGVKAVSMRYKDAPPSEEYRPAAGTEDYIMHAQISLDGNDIYLCDTTPDMPVSFGGGVSVHVTLEDEGAVKRVFDVLKEGGTVSMEPQKTFWSGCFSTLEDRFGMSWMLSVDE